MSTPDPTVALARSPDELTLLEYQQLADLTDRSAPSRRTNFDFPLLGLFGEVGSLLAEVKKKQRDTDSYAGYELAVLEELGDTLWYLANLATRAGLSLPELAAYSETPVARPVEPADRPFQTLQPVFAASGPRPPDAFEAELLRLAGRVGTLVIEVSGRTAPDRNLIAPPGFCPPRSDRGREQRGCAPGACRPPKFNEDVWAVAADKDLPATFRRRLPTQRAVAPLHRSGYFRGAH